MTLTGRERKDSSQTLDLDLGLDLDRRIKKGDVGGAIEIWSSPEGLSPEKVVFTLDRRNPITGDLTLDSWIEVASLRQTYAEAVAKTTRERGPDTKFKDTNEPKVTIHRIAQDGDRLYIGGRLSRYYVLWGLPSVDEGTIWKRGVEEITGGREIEVPLGNSTHNQLLVKNNQTGEPMLVIMAVNWQHGFAAGKLTPTFEHQQHPDLHPHPVDAVVAGFEKEFGINVPEERVRLHGIAAETRSAYVSTFHIADMRDTYTEKDIIQAWENKLAWRQGSSLLFVPVSQLDGWKSEEISATVWSREGVIQNAKKDDEKLKPGKPYNFHHTGPLRIALLQEYLKLPHI